MLKCSEVLERMSAYLDRETEPALSGEISHHLAECSGCRKEAERLSEVDQAVKGLPRYEVSHGFTARLVETVRESAASRTRPALAARIVARILATFEDFTRLLGPQVSDSTHALEEFDDMPSSFMGHAYFRILN